MEHAITLTRCFVLPFIATQSRAGCTALVPNAPSAPGVGRSSASIRCEAISNFLRLPCKRSASGPAPLQSRSIHPISGPCCSASASSIVAEEKIEFEDNKQHTNEGIMHVLFLSNGHGEDTIAVSVLKELMFVAEERGKQVNAVALPLVGVGSAYSRDGIEIVGPSKIMPSGGFIYMDVLQLFGDMRAGLLSLTIEQWRAIVQWLDNTPYSFIIAVGDIFPLALAWLASIHSRRNNNRILQYAFVGTAKSEFYIQDDPDDIKATRKRFHVESLLGGVYLPWERAIMADANCRLVAPRDGFTAEVLKKNLPSYAQAKVYDLGNPMMDGLEPSGALNFLENSEDGHFVTILPGSRAPEVYSNWTLLLKASDEVMSKLYPKVVVYITPIVPSLEPGPFYDSLVEAGWEPYWSLSEHLHSCHAANATCVKEHRNRAELWPANNGLCILQFHKDNAVMLLFRGGFNEASHWAETAMAMAGTGTEQLVGLGKPVFTLPGDGPQFTYAFAEAQSRLLGKSIFLCSGPQSLAMKLSEVLADKASLTAFVENGHKRMGNSGGSRRIAEHIFNIMHRTLT
ncbi:hypothetical protein MPTK1_6g13300 [Marchantia polymorpha subsp. ruderalis]|uniref:Lipid-A-disaccharide synthase n=2 Tax=Marchantia polymorpha TaxID=3197 RepID=A0A176VHY0_MARPO|nr:hypothetical protein AXG93_4698s1310 [Marchantia polymorpha subsp. ruderalis]PTQ37067.1 hypothetical protein MARPO_0059s0019 [Marchantia polymorpha]BBN14652.1 hypothetical protein Mp_6g13300 [Marchantia polymorpha subsp. ruderalis]|eukprot:PTQ37067.1 hypothetical protein MARPO_0059s0019 [Marchantia polymorpha]